MISGLTFRKSEYKDFCSKYFFLTFNKSAHLINKLCLILSVNSAAQGHRRTTLKCSWIKRTARRAVLNSWGLLVTGFNALLAAQFHFRVLPLFDCMQWPPGDDAMTTMWWCSNHLVMNALSVWIWYISVVWLAHTVLWPPSPISGVKLWPRPVVVVTGAFVCIVSNWSPHGHPHTYTAGVHYAMHKSSSPTKQATNKHPANPAPNNKKEKKKSTTKQQTNKKQSKEEEEGKTSQTTKQEEQEHDPQNKQTNKQNNINNREREREREMERAGVGGRGGWKKTLTTDKKQRTLKHLNESAIHVQLPLLGIKVIEMGAGVFRVETVMYRLLTGTCVSRRTQKQWECEKRVKQMGFMG